MDCYRVGCGSGDGKSAPTPPASFSTTLMVGGWTQKGFHMSFDGKYVLAERFDGFSVIDEKGVSKDYKATLLFRNMFWAPDNKHFIFWVPQGVAVGDVDALGEPCGPAKFNLVYKRSAKRHPFGAGWSPRGSDVYVLENYEEEVGPNNIRKGSALQRVSLGGQATEILHHPTRVMWFMPPLTRYEDGSGPSSKSYMILFGAQDGIYIMDRDGGQKEKLCDVSPDGVEDVIWGPGKESTFVFLFRHAQPTPDKKSSYKGVYMVHMDKHQKGKPVELEQLTDRLDIHTLWYSPRGKYIVWASDDEIDYRDPDGKPESKVKVDLKEAGGAVKGCSWDAKEERLAIVAGNRVLVHDASKKTTTLVAKLGDDAKSFGADPQWKGDDVLLTLYTDVGSKKKKK